MAAKIPRSETRYYKEKLHPLVDGEAIKLVGELNDTDKGHLLRGASALLFPIDWPEPFGLVMIEALACGTPVVAFRGGSVVEVIDEGVTGFVVDTMADAIQATGNIQRLSRQQCRTTFERRFNATRMAADYVEVYERLIAARTDGALLPGAA